MNLFFPSGRLSVVDQYYKGVGPGFDLIRTGLAVLIFYGHSKFVLAPVAGDALLMLGRESGPVGSALGGWTSAITGHVTANLYRIYVPMFFALSGFLVAGSAVRLSSPAKFFVFRALRILPALSVEVLLSAIVLGAVFTTLSFTDYFSSARFFSYFGNIVGLVQFDLPGVFTNNPVPDIVNINLWTLPSEFYCYLFVIGFMLFGDVREWRGIFLILVIVFGLAGSIYFFVYPNVRGTFSVAAIIFHFLVGFTFYLYREEVYLHFSIFVMSVVVSIAALNIKSAEFVIALAVSYMTIYIGYVGVFRLNILRKYDYSYGIYLYGFPIKQAIVALFPTIGRMTLFFSALAITVLFSAISWRYIEKRCLALKDKVRFGR